MLAILLQHANDRCAHRCSVYENKKNIKNTCSADELLLFVTFFVRFFDWINRIYPWLPRQDRRLIIPNAVHKLHLWSKQATAHKAALASSGPVTKRYGQGRTVDLLYSYPEYWQTPSCSCKLIRRRIILWTAPNLTPDHRLYNSTSKPRTSL